MSPPQFKEKFAEYAELSDVEFTMFISTNNPLKEG
jgi:ribosomal protein L30E